MSASETLELLTGGGLLPPLAMFVALGAAVFAIASRLATHADAIAAATGLGRVFVGTLVLAASTSLPELATDVNAAWLGAVDIGVGDLMGSTLANMLILALADLAWRRRRVLDRVSPDHLLVASLGILLTALAGAAIASGGGWLRIGHVGAETLAIATMYAGGMRIVYASRLGERRAAPATAPASEPAAAHPADGAALRSAVVGFGIAALALLATAPLLVIAAEALAIESGAGQTAVGTLLVGFTTSFPEMAATIAAIRLGAADLAVGNVFGSNAFNMGVLAAMDLAYMPGPVLAAASAQHAVSAQLAVLAMALGVIAIARRGRGTSRGLRVESVLIVATYALAAVLLASGP